MKICPYCGKEIIEGTKFCGGCGKEIAIVSTKPQAQVRLSLEELKKPLLFTGGILIGIIVAIVVAIVIIAVIFIVILPLASQTSGEGYISVTVKNNTQFGQTVTINIDGQDMESIYLSAGATVVGGMNYKASVGQHTVMAKGSAGYIDSKSVYVVKGDTVKVSLILG